MVNDSSTAGGLRSLFSVGTLPGNPEEARSFLQRRVALFIGLVVAILGGAYLAIATVSLAIGDPRRELGHPVRLMHLALVALFGGVWLFLRGGRRSLRCSGAIDAVGTIVLCATYGIASGTVPVVRNSTVGFILVLTYTLVARAATVPSTPTRTFALGVLGALPLIVVTYLSNRAASFVPPFVGAPIGASIAAAVWLLVTIGLTTAISRIIYGLHRRIEEVAQLGQYTLEEKIGEGGMGVVYRARHAMLRRPTAIKLLPPGKAGERMLSRFEREVQITARLTHPNTIAIYDYGRTPDGVFYYAMELLDGLDLDELVRLDGAQPPARVVHILAHVAQALAEAHAAGLIHRDIKPANVILCERGGNPDFVKVVDFGLVKESEPDTDVSQSSAQRPIGTPSYMSPESIVAPLTVDGRTDIYALGALGYFLLAGVDVFAGASVLEAFARHLHERVVPPSERAGRAIPPALEAIVLACLEKEPDQRPPSASVLAKALGALADPPRWTDEDARAWWTAHQGALRDRRRKPLDAPVALRTRL